MTLGEVIKQYRDENDISMDEFARISGISKGYISMLERDKNPQSGKSITPSIDMYANVAKGMNISIETLLSITKGADVALVHDRDSFSDNSNQIIYGSFSYTFIPTKVSAGALEDVEAIYECPKIDVPDAILGKYARDKNIVFMGVNGESMNKVIANGAIIAVKTNIEKESLKNGDIVIASYQNEYVMKHFIDNQKGEEFILRPDSTDPSFTDKIIRYEDAENLKIFGKVVIYSVVL